MSCPLLRASGERERQIGKLDEETVATALRILEDAADRSPGRAVNTLEIRLALLTSTNTRATLSRSGSSGSGQGTPAGRPTSD